MSELPKAEDIRIEMGLMADQFISLSAIEACEKFAKEYASRVLDYVAENVQLKVDRKFKQYSIDKESILKIKKELQ